LITSTAFATYQFLEQFQLWTIESPVLVRRNASTTNGLSYLFSKKSRSVCHCNLFHCRKLLLFCNGFWSFEAASKNSHRSSGNVFAFSMSPKRTAISAVLEEMEWVVCLILKISSRSFSITTEPVLELEITCTAPTCQRLWSTVILLLKWRTCLIFQDEELYHDYFSSRQRPDDMVHNLHNISPQNSRTPLWLVYVWAFVYYQNESFPAE
jgi:hypothetical protein